MHAQAECGNENDLEDYRAHAPRGHAVLDALRPILDVRSGERQQLNNPLLPQPFVQRIAADPKAFCQL